MKLIRYTNGSIDWRMIDEMRHSLEQAAAGEVSSIVDAARDIAAFQEDDGGFGLCRDKYMPSDAQMDLVNRTTCLCTAAMIRAALSDAAVAIELRPHIGKALAACAAYGFCGHGYDADAHLEEMVRVLRAAGCTRYLETAPDCCPQFTRIWRKLDGVIVFVYGTLMQGESNHHYMKSSTYLGKGEVHGYRKAVQWGLPVAIREQNSRISGEYYRVPDNALKLIDRLEGEGSLYKREDVVIHEEGSFSTVPGIMYVPVQGGHSLVWYVAYGSNMTYDRFRYYIEGGLCPFNGKRYDGCRDNSEPKDTRAVIIPYEMYYGGKSGTWGGKGVAFVDRSTPGTTLGRAYLITEEQLEDIRQQEGPSERWYGNRVRLADIDGIPAYTLTSAIRREANQPADEYIRLIEKGRRETIISCSRHLYKKNLNEVATSVFNHTGALVLPSKQREYLKASPLLHREKGMETKPLRVSIGETQIENAHMNLVSHDVYQLRLGREGTDAIIALCQPEYSAFKAGESVGNSVWLSLYWNSDLERFFLFVDRVTENA